MPKRKCAVLIVFASLLLIAPAAFGAEMDAKGSEEKGATGSDNPEALRQSIYKEAEAYQAEDKIDQAIAALQKGLKVLPGDEGMLNRLGELYSQKKDFDNAAGVYKKLLEMNPGSFNYMQRIESSYLQAGRLEDAELFCKEIVVSNLEAWVKDWADTELMGLYYRQGRLGELAPRFEKELASSPNDITRYRKLADLYQRDNQREEAIEVYEKAIDAGLSDRDDHNRLLELYERAEKFDKAEVHLEKMIEMWPEDAGLVERLANLKAVEPEAPGTETAPPPSAIEKKVQAPAQIEDEAKKAVTPAPEPKKKKRRGFWFGR